METETTEMGTDAPPQPPPFQAADEQSPLDIFCQDQDSSAVAEYSQTVYEGGYSHSTSRSGRVGAAYFRAMADGQAPPVKETLEYPLMESKDGLTVGLLRVLDRQLKDHIVTLEKVRGKWAALCLETRAFNDIVEIGHFREGENIDWKKIMAVLCTSLGTVSSHNLTVSFILIFFTSFSTGFFLPESDRHNADHLPSPNREKEGGDPVIPYVVWWELYLFLARGWMGPSLPSNSKK
ncbi:Ropporin-1-like protein [Orchesella cincta]|uniref:Ropporin-1-like protein n=1 Tax=Orchesella cincta TaxID=48709 RepID=A0A1D2MF11_ORCCI|nr:Ropporin-1-like protein [Orchesella cincta]